VGVTHDSIRARLLALEAADPHLRVYRVSYPGAVAQSMPLASSHPLVTDGAASYVTHDGQEFDL
jgi:hypothetical protein